MLFELNSVEDLFCRGFTQAQILENVGVDIGYHGSKIRDIIKNVNRHDYYVEFVRVVSGIDAFVLALHRFADGKISTEDVYYAVGLGYMAARLNLGDFCESLGVGDIWPDIRLRAYGGRFLKIRKTMVERYGHEYSFQCPELAAKSHATMKRKYGAEHMRQIPELVKKADDTTERHFGVRKSGSSPVVKAKREATLMRKYGASHPMQIPEIKAKQRATMIDRYGAPFSLQSPILKPIIDATVLERYGVSACTQNQAVKDKAYATNLARYGVGYFMQSPDFRRRAMDTKRVLGTFSSSSGENLLYDKLVGFFGKDDVIRQYHSDLYPYDCDFYIKSRDMYIELNAFKGHGRHWFGSCESDNQVAVDWKNSSKRPGDFYDVTLDVWTCCDVDKRDIARKNNLNYVVFWDVKISDADLWFALGCPDGRDWEREYSWIPDRVLYYDGAWPKNLTLGSGVVSAAAHMANWRIFYEGEIALWNKRYDSKWGTIPVRLYSNRLKYLNKDICKLTNRDVLRGLNISGMYHGYSSYNNSGMVEFLEKYKPNFVYDPCAGWGERMLTCAASGIQYLGVDINKRLMPGYLRLMRHYNLDNVGLIHGDSSKIDLSHGQQDCVFTCPPYEGFEIYTEFGAENLSHDDFINWWQSVVQHSVGPNTRIFAYQINQSCKSDMNQVLLDAGWRLDSQIPVNVGKISHLSKSKGVKKKKNFEEIQVFVRDI